MPTANSAVDDAIGVERRLYANLLASAEGGRNERLYLAFASVPREAFSGAPPWVASTYRGGSVVCIPSNRPDLLHQDVLLSICPVRGLNSGLPSLHAHLLMAAGINEGDRAIHVGLGLGYYTAIISHLVGPSGSVLGFEIEADLAEKAARNLAQFDNVKVLATSAVTADLPQADLIYVSAGVADLPKAWLDALRVGGRMVVPLTCGNASGVLLLIERREMASYHARIVGAARFVACQNTRDAAIESMLHQRLARHNPAWPNLSLRRDGAPDQSCWVAGRDWWLAIEGD